MVAVTVLIIGVAVVTVVAVLVVLAVTVACMCRHHDGPMLVVAIRRLLPRRRYHHALTAIVMHMHIGIP